MDGKPLSGDDIDLAYVGLSAQGYKAKKGEAADAILKVAFEKRFHPVRHYLESLRGRTDLPEIDIHTLARKYLGLSAADANDANGDLAQARFFIDPSTLCALLKQVIDADGGETTAQPQGDGYRFACIRVHTSTAVTENKIVLADVPTIHIVRYGPAMLLVDPFSAGRSTTGETQIVIQNYIDTMIADRNLVVIGSA